MAGKNQKLSNLIDNNDDTKHDVEPEDRSYTDNTKDELEARYE